jgi:hypothetical protein
MYDRLFNYLELGKRVELLNKRLDIMKELLDMLADEQQNAHATKLEWIIIWLIVFEVIIMVICMLFALPPLPLYPTIPCHHQTHDWLMFQIGDIIIKDILGIF